MIEPLIKLLSPLDIHIAINKFPILNRPDLVNPTSVNLLDSLAARLKGGFDVLDSPSRLTQPVNFRAINRPGIMLVLVPHSTGLQGLALAQ